MQKRIAIIAGGVVVVLVAGFFGVRAYRAHVQNVAVQKQPPRTPKLLPSVITPS